MWSLWFIHIIKLPFWILVRNDHRELAPRVLAQLFSGSCPRYTKVLSAIFQGPVRVGYFNTFAQLFFSGFCPIISRICPIISGFCPIISGFCPIISFHDFAHLLKGFVQLFQGFAKCYVYKWFQMLSTVIFDNVRLT